MARNVVVGLIQASTPFDPSWSVQKIKDTALEKHLPLIDEAGKKGVQILGLQEIFNGPYFCPSQDPKWYAAAEACPGPTTEVMQKYAKKYEMAIVVPIYEREQAGVYYNTAAVIDADGTYLGKYRKNHIPHTNGFWEKFFFKPGNLGYPVFQTRYDLRPELRSRAGAGRRSAARCAPDAVQQSEPVHVQGYGELHRGAGPRRHYRPGPAR